MYQESLTWKILSIFDDELPIFKGILVKLTKSCSSHRPNYLYKVLAQLLGKGAFTIFWEIDSERHFFPQPYFFHESNACCSSTVVLNVFPFYTHIHISHTPHTIHTHASYIHTSITHTHTCINAQTKDLSFKSKIHLRESTQQLLMKVVAKIWVYREKAATFYQFIYLKHSIWGAVDFLQIILC